MSTPAAVIITLLALLYTALFIHVATRHIERFTMSSQQTIIDAVVAQLNKAHGEIVARIHATETSLQEQLAAVSAGTLPAEEVDLSALAAIAQALDDIVPDVEEAVTEEVVEEVLEETDEAVEVTDEVEETVEDETVEAVEEVTEEVLEDENQ